jgi:DnaJ-class molecular chaperone
VNIFDCYKTLGLTRQATDQEVKEAHRRLSRVLHPDKGGEDPVAFDQVQKSYQALKTMALRSRHASLMASMGDICGACDGRGVTIRQKSFTRSVKTPCPFCNGCGYKQRERV